MLVLVTLQIFLSGMLASGHISGNVTTHRMI